MIPPPTPRPLSPEERQRQDDLMAQFYSQMEASAARGSEARRNGTIKTFRASPEARARADVRKRLRNVRARLETACVHLRGDLASIHANRWARAPGLFEGGREYAARVIDSLCRVYGDSAQGCAISHAWLSENAGAIARLESLLQEEAELRGR